jgi:hypothetical protein
MIEIEAPVHGNAQVIALLESYLAKARLGKINYGLVAVTELPDKGDYDVAGSTEMEDVALAALILLKEKIEGAQINRSLPERSPDAPADRVCYNIAGGSVGFDFVPWFIDAEMTRRREGAPAPLKVAFFMGRNGRSGLNTHQRRQMFHCVIRPLLKLVGAVEDQSALNGRSKALVHHQDIIPAYLNGEEVPRLRPTERERQRVGQDFKGTDYVTITLREADHYPQRNSNLDAWRRFAHDLSQTENVVFVRDTAKAFSPLGGFHTYPLASININTRVALYEQAKCNLFVSNGPHVLALFGTRPWLTFIKLDEKSSYEPMTSKWWRESCGIEAGSQFPWCAPDQRIVWECDTYGNLCRAWERFSNNKARVAA